ncbi:hypothetical protein [Kitasatospora sp. NPDC092286]|uniref:hypothetical protein n=1 Tax=Kitasatospora sp. NPDC092286 TaxID=3364087 RepID=UPI003806D363
MISDTTRLFATRTDTQIWTTDKKPDASWTTLTGPAGSRTSPPPSPAERPTPQRPGVMSGSGHHPRPVGDRHLLYVTGGAL